MSSNYRLICLSHNPGIELDTEWHSGSDGRNTAERTLATIKDMPQIYGEGNDELLSHAYCDLVIGQYSYPLVSVGYLTYPKNPVFWIDTEWLRVLAAAVLIHDKTGAQIPPLPHWWTAERVRHLAPLLGREFAPEPVCVCHNWCHDSRVGWPDGHHPRCDGTGQHKTETA